MLSLSDATCLLDTLVIHTINIDHTDYTLPQTATFATFHTACFLVTNSNEFFIVVNTKTHKNKKALNQIRSLNQLEFQVERTIPF